MPGIRLTQVAHPDLNGGQSTPVFLRSEDVIVINRGQQTFTKMGSQEAHRQALESLHEEVQRINEEANRAPSMVPHDEEDAKKIDRFMRVREAAAALNAAWGLIQRAASGPSYYPAIECTEVCLACGTALEHGVMLARIWVTETPEEVARAIGWISDKPSGHSFKSDLINASFT